MKNPEKISEKIILDNGYRKIISKEFVGKKGKSANFLTTSHSGIKKAVVILALTKDKKLICIKEFRYGIEDILIGFPMGGVEKEFTLRENALKELREESGYISDKVELIGENIVGNYDDTKVFNFIAKDCSIGNQDLESTEFIEYFEISIKDFEQKIIDGEIKCPLTLSCFCMAKIKGLI